MPDKNKEKKEIPKSERRAIRRVLDDEENGKPAWLGAGVDLWNENPKEVDPISEEEKQLIQDMFSNPEFPESEKYDYEEAIEEEVRKHSKKKNEEEES